MDDRIMLGLLAIAAGAVMAVVLFVPFVAISYRRRGGLTFWRAVGWAAFLVYFFAIWTYTLLPLPDPDTIRCVGANLDPRSVLDDIRDGLDGPGSPLTSPQILQLVFNVLLFVPLGFFLRVLLGRGVVVTVLVGFAVSLFIETTQLTGVWGIYPCAYRFFDVGDLMTNTTGALLGAVLSLVIPKRHRGLARAADAGEPDPVTKPRRLLAMLCDVLGALVLQAAVGVGLQVALLAIDRERFLDGALSSLVATATAIAVWFIVVMATGRTVGDLAVELRYRGGRLPEPLARFARLAGGVGGYLALGLLPAPWSVLQVLFALTAVVLVFTTSRGRGLPGILTGRRLEDARERDLVP